MVSLKMKAERHAELLGKIKGNVVKVNPERVTIYSFEKGKSEYASRWMSRKEYDSLKRSAIGVEFATTFRGVELPSGFVKPKLTGIPLEIPRVVVKEIYIPELMRKYPLVTRLPRKFRVFAYTKAQREYARRLMERKKIPITAITRTRIEADLLEPFSEVGVGIKETGETP